MNTYDPLSHTVYVHPTGAEPRSRSSVPTTTCTALPAGYANRSWPTRLARGDGRRSGHPARVSCSSAPNAGSIPTAA
jgi:hypothetical protein